MGNKQWKMGFGGCGGYCGAKALSALLCMSLCMAVPMQVMAEAGPGLSEEQQDQPYDEATMARLQDNVLEFDEIDKMVHLYNPNMVNAWSTIQNSVDAIDRSVTELKSAQKAMEMAKDDAKDVKDPVGAAVYGAQASALKSIADGMRKGKDTIEKPSTTAQLRQAEYSVVKATQGLMISYSSLLAQKETVVQMKNLYEAKAAMTGSQLRAGMVTEADVLAAQAELLSAQSALLNIQQSEDQLRRNLLLLVGQPSTSQMVIQPVAPAPDADMARIHGADLSEDTGRAIGNNSELISMRHAAGGSSANINKRFRAVQEGEQKLAIEMQRLYQDAYNKKLAYDAAMTGYQNAELLFASAQRKKEHGLVGNTEYQALELSAIQKRSEKAAAEIALLQAIEDYEWAVRGVLLDQDWME